MKSVITKLEARNEDQTYGRIPYDVEIKGERPANVVVAKLPKISDATQTLVEITTPLVGGSTALAVSTMDAIARRILPDARHIVTYPGESARRRVYASN
jgi:hypothetical protein